MTLAFRTGMGLILLALLGCGGEAKPAAVQGRVLFRGQPLGGGTVVFTPDAERGASGPLATAEIGADGRYSLRTNGQPGAVPGWHRVTVAPPSRSQAAGSPVLATLPRHYSHAEHSGQCHEVKPGIVNTIDIQLE